MRLDWSQSRSGSCEEGKAFTVLQTDSKCQTASLDFGDYQSYGKIKRKGYEERRETVNEDVEERVEKVMDIMGRREERIGET
jgi:hypothetical protein